MEKLRITRVTKALGLTRQIVGVRFLVYKKEYEQSDAVEENVVSICKMVGLAGAGKKVKAKCDNLDCQKGAYAVGLAEVPELVRSGRGDYRSGKYESVAVARQVYDSKKYIPQKIYGIEIAPLIEMEEADLALIISSAKSMMRIMQGYVRHYGVARNILTVGTQGVCSDLISKPFMKNDIQVSLLSCGARKNGGYSEQEMGASMPIHFFTTVMDGILETVNLTENNKPKQEILERLDDPEELGFAIRMNYDYAIQGMEYQKHCEECMTEENEN